ncbi:unnamed protein product [Brassica rapa]|uniref:Myb-like domain-containing protein n=1 Tax=Brassica campestris TaxID=3711 RepID=A0A8D9DDG0_BRACM|nr:unnamed protein product [Brassica rapa]
MATCIRKPSPNPEPPQLQTPRARSPLSENLSPSTTTFPRSPLSFISPHTLSPLKLSSPKLVTPTSLRADDDDDEDEDMSISSGSDALGGVNELLSDYDLDDDEVVRRYYDEEEVFGPTRPTSKLNRGVLKDMNLRIEVPFANGRVTDGESRLRRFALANSTPGSYLRDERPRTLSSTGSVYWESNEDIGTPSAPPIMDIGEDDNIVELEKEIEQIEDEICREVGVESHHQQVNIGGLAGDTVSHLYPEFSESVRETQTGEAAQMEDISSDELNCHSISGQYAWQSLLAYDACVRLCLYAWSRGSSEAPEFLRDECRLLRGAFGLHKFLLQPRGVRSTEESKNVKVEQKTPLKSKNVVRKLRVEVRRLRLIPQRKLRGIDSLRSLMSTPMGAEYCRQVSSLVKTGMSSIKTATLSAVSEEEFSCYLQMKSTAEGDQVEQGSSVCLQSGTGSYHVFFPEPEGDALLIEVHDKKKSVQGKVSIPMASLTDNPNENVRWWPIYHGEQDCVGKIQLFLGSTTSSDEDCHIKSAPVVETLAYDLLLEAATRAQRFHAQNLRLNGSWKWLLSEFAEYYGVSDSYTKLRYLSHVMNVATPTKTCLQLVHELLVPILSARSDKSLTRQEKSILMDCEIEIEKLLANVFENYKSLDESCPSGLAHISRPVQESASTALAPAVQIFCLLHDILSPEGQEILKNYLKTAAKKRCRKHMAETDEYVSSNSEGFLLDSVTISTAYHKMKNLCLNISNEIEADIKITNEHVLPSSIDLSNIAAAVYSTLLCNRIRAFLSAVPPSCPQPHVNELLIAVSDFERSLDSWGISPVQGGIDSRGLFHNYIMVWIHDMELRLLDRCKAEKVPWSGVITNHSTSPFAEDMYERIKDSLMEYEVVISRWPQYTLILENTASIIERAIVKSLEKQYSEILTPLKDSIPKRLNLHVQKLTRRQSSALYSVPTQLGTFVNTIKRILDVLHQRVEDILRQWASCLPVVEDKKSLFGEQMNVITVLLRTKYRNYMQAAVDKLVSNTQSNKTTRLKKILEEIRENEREVEVRERMRMLCSQITDSISNMHDVFTSQIFVASCRLFWDRMAQVVLKFLEGRKENEVGYKGSYYALGIVEDTFASEMQRLQGNSLQEKDMEAPRSVIEARSILSRDTTNHSSYFYGEANERFASGVNTTHCVSGDAERVPDTFDERDVPSKKRHCLGTSETTRGGGGGGGGSNLEACIVCDISDEGVSRCSGTGCILWFHGECLNPDLSSSSSEDLAKTYCPYCWFRVLMMKHESVRKKGVVAEKEVSKCLSKDHSVDGTDVVRDQELGGEKGVCSSEKEQLQVEKDSDRSREEEMPLTEETGYQHQEDTEKFQDAEEDKDDEETTKDQTTGGAGGKGDVSGEEQDQSQQNEKPRRRRRQLILSCSEISSDESTNERHGEGVTEQITGEMKNQQRKHSATTQVAKSKTVRLDMSSLKTDQRKRLFWTPEEEEMLKVGVEKFSAEAKKNMPWRKILEMGAEVFHETRTPADLKDKWRNRMGVRSAKKAN